MNEILSWISLISGISSVILAVIAILFARSAETQTTNNFIKTQEVMEQQHSKTKDVLNEIDKRAAIMEKTVTESQEKLLTTITKIIDEVVIPKRPQIGEQFAMLLLQQLIKDPETAEKIIKSMTAMTELAQKAVK